jgi:hypothetical protein
VNDRFAVVILGNSITYGGDWPQLLTARTMF